MKLDPQDITNILTLVLAVTTVWLGFATHSMAKATRQAVEMQAQAYLSLDGISLALGQGVNLGTTGLVGISRLALLLSNPGQVLVTYEVEELVVTFNDAQVQQPEFHTRRGVLHPKAQNQFYYPSIQFPGDLRPGMSGEVKFKIAFWVTLHHVQHVSGRVQYTLQSVAPPALEWIYLEGPVYA